MLLLQLALDLYKVFRVELGQLEHLGLVLCNLALNSLQSLLPILQPGNFFLATGHTLGQCKDHFFQLLRRLLLCLFGPVCFGCVDVEGAEFFEFEEEVIAAVGSEVRGLALATILGSHDLAVARKMLAWVAYWFLVLLGCLEELVLEKAILAGRMG